MVGSAHAAGAAIDLDRQPCGHLAPCVIEFIDRKINTVGAAAGAAGQAGMAHGDGEGARYADAALPGFCLV